MTIFDAILLGVVEGITEFLPVSSTAHLVMTSRFLGLGQSDFVKSFEIVVQGGAILAVLFVSLRMILREKSLIGKTLVAFLPTAVAGLLLYPLVKEVLLGNYFIIPCALITGGIVMIIFERHEKSKGAEMVASGDVSYRNALLIGIAQILALIPGISRSATTIVAGRKLGISKNSIVKFSFLLAIPTIGAATLYELLKSMNSIMEGSMSTLVVGFAVSFVVAYVSISWLLSYIKNHTFEGFGWYRIVIGVIFLVILLA